MYILQLLSLRFLVKVEHGSRVSLPGVTIQIQKRIKKGQDPEKKEIVLRPKSGDLVVQKKLSHATSDGGRLRSRKDLLLTAAALS